MRVRSGLVAIGITLTLHAQFAQAQASAVTTRPPASAQTAQQPFAVRYADALGVGYRSEAKPRSQPAPSMIVSARQYPAATPVPASERLDRTCPMPVHVIDPNRMAPMPRVATDTATNRASVASRVPTCVNTLAP